MTGFTFDAGGLITLDRKDRMTLALVARAKERNLTITVPATALSQAMRNPARQALLSRFVRQSGTDLIPLDGPDAMAIGQLLARTGTTDIVDAHVVICANRASQPVLTSGAGDLRRLAPALQLISV